MNERQRCRVFLLGGARVATGRDEAAQLERKSAAVLAVLALDQTASRARLASLCWPQASEKTARANLRQLLRRLRRTVGVELVDGGDALRLVDDVSVDARGDGWGCELLAGYEYDDCPEFAEWLMVQRERLRNVQRVALAAAADRLEAAGDTGAALECAARLASVHPESEEAHRRVIRLCLAQGDRAAAMRAYQLCCSMVRSLCGGEVSPQTAALEKEIVRGPRAAPPPRSRRSHAE